MMFKTYHWLIILFYIQIVQSFLVEFPPFVKMIENEVAISIIQDIRASIFIGQEAGQDIVAVPKIVSTRTELDPKTFLNLKLLYHSNKTNIILTGLVPSNSLLSNEKLMISISSLSTQTLLEFQIIIHPNLGKLEFEDCFKAGHVEYSSFQIYSTVAQSLLNFTIQSLNYRNNYAVGNWDLYHPFFKDENLNSTIKGSSNSCPSLRTADLSVWKPSLGISLSIKGYVTNNILLKFRNQNALDVNNTWKECGISLVLYDGSILESGTSRKINLISPLQKREECINSFNAFLVKYAILAELSLAGLLLTLILVFIIVRAVKKRNPRSESSNRLNRK